MLKTVRIARPLTRLITSNLSEHLSGLKVNQSPRVIPATTKSFKFHTSGFVRQKNEDGDEEEGDDGVREEAIADSADWINRRVKDPRDRTREIPLELSMAYLDSAAYKETYGDNKVWELYRRNFPNNKKPEPRTRRKCIVFGRVSGGNPCPICRDEYLVVDYRNVKLIQQFLTDYNRQIIGMQKSGVCREQHKKLMIAIEKAKDHGYLDVDAEFVEYDYTKYRPAINT